MSKEITEVIEVEEDNVRNRLLDAAEKLFCEKGFDGVSVRELTGLAACNVAAVNYYFGGKDKLYMEMFRRQMQFIVENQIIRLNDLLAGQDTTLEKLIYELIFYPLRSAFEKNRRGDVMKLMVREVLNHSLAREKIIEDFRSKIMDKAVEVLMRLIPELNKKKAQLIFASIESLHMHPFLFMDCYMNMIETLTFDELVEHIVQFAAAAIREMVKNQG